MDFKNNFTELENQAKLSATKLIAEQFQRYENLDKISQLKKRYKLQEEATEAQLKLAIQTQLDGVKDGLEKLDSAYLECRKIQERMEEISNALINTKSLSNGLEQLQAQSKQQNQLAAAMQNMDYLVKVPEMMHQAEVLLDGEYFLLAHKIIEELEGTRDEIMRELHNQKSSEMDLQILDSFFTKLSGLDKQMLRHIEFMGERVINASVTQNVILVNCIRIIDREERIDELWINRQANESFMPHGRPKRWKDQFLAKTKVYVRQKIFESALDEEQQKGFLPRHLETIRLHTMADLTVIKNIGVAYFPPRYRIYDEFVRMYHSVICDYVTSKANNLQSPAESFQLLGWINDYHSQDFMGSPDLAIDSNTVFTTNCNLLSLDMYDKVAHFYLENQRVSLQSWFSNTVLNDIKDWESEQPPPFDGSSKYHTSISTMMLQPLSELLGKGKVLHHLGEKMRERYFPMFLEEVPGFQTIYTRELKLYRDRYLKSGNIPMHLEYLVANCNNCVKLKSELEDMIKKDLEDSPSIMVKIDSTLQSHGKEMLNLAQLCLDFIKEILFNDLSKVLVKVMSDDWAFGNANVSDYVIGTVVDYNGTLVYLMRSAYARLIASVVEQIVVEYVKNLITKRLTLNNEDRKRVGSKILNDGDRFQEYFSREMNLDKKITSCIEVIPAIAKLMLNSDTGMIRLDIDTLMKKYPGIRKDQLVLLLMMRGDMRIAEAKEIAVDYSYNSPEDKTNIFLKVAASMGQS